MFGMLSEAEIAKIVMMRGLGYSQKEIAGQLSITQGAVSYNLKQLRTAAERDGLESTFLRVMASGIGVEKLREAGLI